ncbi:LANO_0F05116g1_1 [Lachancea nothofagi CBS 11611]|uniref:LANO_0F05116g1_1 n=1 Tax=Lachancea nothofagi CBS 11611 TaxID=1266666 RepID=A0A1G4K7Y6_9SACH|nr:LANO_0F05116g1_1 [Lachancea nothofagi CBS 11611]
MSAFNDFCVVCERLIDGPSRLYCSESCCQHDENSKRRKSVVESLVATPQLCPMDFDAGNDSEEDDLLELDYTATVPTTLSSPRQFEKQQHDSYFSLASEVCFDHTAEDNYKLWLNARSV